MRRFGAVVVGIGMVALGLAWRGVEVRAASSDRTAVTVTAGQQGGQSAVAPTLQLYSRETVVDVTVTDANGQPVHGLTQADFTVKENGKEQAIRSFKETDAAAEQAGLKGASALEPEVHSNYRGAPASGPVNILLIDSLNASSTGMVVHVQRETEKYLKTMPEGTQVAVFSLSQGGLRVMQGFTPDRELLIGAVRRAAAMHGNVERWTRDWLTTDAMDEIAVYVSGIKGRKNLIWLTPGMPVMLTRDGGYQYGGGEMGPIHRLMDAYELLTRAQVAIYPVDPRGVGPRMSMNTMLAEQVAEESGVQRTTTPTIWRRRWARRLRKGLNTTRSRIFRRETRTTAITTRSGWTWTGRG